MKSGGVGCFIIRECLVCSLGISSQEGAMAFEVTCSKVPRNASMSSSLVSLLGRGWAFHAELGRGVVSASVSCQRVRSSWVVV